jgi:hypothetical protein
MKKIIFFFVGLLAVSLNGYGQCPFNNYSLNTSSAPSDSGNFINITSCIDYGKYTTLNTMSDTLSYEIKLIPAGYITIFNASNVPVAFGQSPLVFTPPAAGSYKCQWNGPNCSSDYSSGSPCLTALVTNLGPTSPCSNALISSSIKASMDFACTGQSFKLSLPFSFADTGYTYQWKSSPSVSGPFTSITGATNPVCQTTQSAVTYYRCYLTCSSGMTDSSSVFMMPMGHCFSMPLTSAGPQAISDSICGSYLFDNGGSNSDYTNSETQQVLTIFPPSNQYLQITFDYFQLEALSSPVDVLTVYNGSSTSSPVLGTFSTNPYSVTSTDGMGALTLKFTSNASTVNYGWQARLSCVNLPTNDIPCQAMNIVLDSTYSLSNGGATVDSNETIIVPPLTGFLETNGWGTNTLSSTVWFKFIAPASGGVEISCTDQLFDGQVAIYKVNDCTDYGTFTFIAGNDHALDSTSVSPNFQFCGLVPNATYYIMYDSRFDYSSGSFSLRLTPLFANAGVPTAIQDVCSGDTVNLFEGITGYQQGGSWTQVIPTLGLHDSIFYTAGLGYQIFDFKYIVKDYCLSDTSIAKVKVFGPSNAGNDGTILACKNDVVNLLNGLTGNVDMGGTWYNSMNLPLDSCYTNVGAFAGQFNYDYITGNGVCPNDTANILVIVQDNCTSGMDELALEEIMVYPNPTDGLLYVSSSSLEEQYSYEIINIEGRVIQRQNDVINSVAPQTIDLTACLDGLYMIRIYNDYFEKMVRVVLK